MNAYFDLMYHNLYNPKAKEIFKLDYVDNREIYKFETSVFQPYSMKAVYDLLEKLYGIKEKSAF